MGYKRNDIETPESETKSSKRRTPETQPTESVGKDKGEGDKTLPPPATPINKPHKPCTKPEYIYKKMCANVALVYYNNKNDTKFEYAKDEASDCFFCPDYSGSYIHCSFSAKEGSFVNQFFAEIEFVYPEGPAITTCVKLEGETQVGCKRCHSAVTHPLSEASSPKEPTDGYAASPENNYDFTYHFRDSEYFVPEPNFNAKLENEGYDDAIILNPVNKPEKPCSKAQFVYQKMCANIALGYYNNQNDTKFELVKDETLDSFSFPADFGSWTHCCFNAKDGSSVNEFFAEIKFEYPSSGPAVNTCVKLEGETKVGCRKCHRAVTHPIFGYRGDNSPDKPTLEHYMYIYPDFIDVSKIKEWSSPDSPDNSHIGGEWFKYDDDSGYFPEGDFN